MDEIRATPRPFEEGRAGSALRFGRWLTVEPDGSPHPALLDACRLELVGDSEKAMARLSEALEDEGPSPALLEARGALYLVAGFPRAAAGDFLEASRLAPERPQAWFALGYAYQLLGLSRQALGALDQALSLGARETGMFLARARAFRALGRAGAAAREYRSALGTGTGQPTEILVDTITLVGSEPSRARRVETTRERLEACQGTTLSDDGWLLRALLAELHGESEEEVRTAFRALDVAPSELAQLAHSLLVAIQLADEETCAVARTELLEHETDADRRFRLERCLALP